MGAILDAADESDREFLVALRDHLARTLDGSPPPHTIAGLTRQLLEVREKLKALDSAEGGDDIGEALNTPDEPFDPSAI